MMICKADFEELFPHLFEAKDHFAIETSSSTSEVPIDRWKDDGGTVRQIRTRHDKDKDTAH